MVKTRIQQIEGDMMYTIMKNEDVVFFKVVKEDDLIVNELVNEVGYIDAQLDYTIYAR